MYGIITYSAYSETFEYYVYKKKKKKPEILIRTSFKAVSKKHLAKMC